MKVSFTAKEYARVLELTQMGLQVAAGGSEQSDSLPERYAAIEQKLLALASPLGCADLVAETADGFFIPSEKLESGAVTEKLGQFSEDIFWRELVERLAERDLGTERSPIKHGVELTAEETQRLEAIEDGYWREFEAHGTDQLVLLKGGRG